MAARKKRSRGAREVTGPSEVYPSGTEGSNEKPAQATETTEATAAERERALREDTDIRRKRAMPDEVKPVEGHDTLTKLFFNYVEGVRDAQLNAQKHDVEVHRSYVEALQNSVREASFEDVVRAYEGVKAAWARHDAQGYLESCQHYATALQEANISLERRLRQAYEDFVEGQQNACQGALNALKTEIERMLGGLRDA